MKENKKIIDLKITKYSRDGKGIAFSNGRQHIVDGALKDETVRCDSSGESLEIIAPSPYRVTPPCKSFPRCGNCNLLYAAYEEQLKIKRDIVAECLQDTVADGLIADTVGMHYPFKYRNKIHLAFSQNQNGKIKIGFFEEGTTRIIDFKKCLLHDKFAEILISALRKFLTENKIKIYGEKNRQGLRFAAARHIDNNLMLTLVSTYPALPGADGLFEELSKSFAEVSLYLNVNRAENSMVFSDKFIHLKGKPSISGKQCGISFEYYPSAFIQVNDNMASKVYNEVLKSADLDQNSVVIDLYSGIGITSVLFAKKCARVYSIELSKDAVKAACVLKKANNLSDKIINISGDAGAELTKLSMDAADNRFDIKAVNTIKSKNREAERISGYASGELEYIAYPKQSENLIVFADPPRNGLDERVIKSILRLKPKQIIYLSCNPVTLNENLKEFLNGYTVGRVIPYDMFPQTKHIEALVFLDRTDLKK
ncbi:MAG: class I SAM-dependent RNA methyltransferase [Clostridiales bacterium]|jgi:23S rRNA (uracil1939-C5)-methyltransferase|nr:class I SAM-dependent RNA methyltransferase [Clostridiales bacterium]